MALVPADCATNLTTMYVGLAGLQESGEINPLNEDWTFNSSGADFAAEFATFYNDYATQGEVLGATNTGGDPALLEAVMKAPTTPQALGKAFADFWALVALTPGPPMHGGISPISVTNDAASKVDLFVGAVLASVTDQRSQPYFLNLISNVETMAVKSIVWTVTELMPGVPPFPMVFPEAIA